MINPAPINPKHGKLPSAQTEKKTRAIPRYHVVLWNDEYHSFEYVVQMLQALFGYNPQRGYQIAQDIDTHGNAVCLTTTLEHAEFKRDQIQAFGRDKLVNDCTGSMYATIEALPSSDN